MTSNVNFPSALDICSTRNTCVVNLTHPHSGECLAVTFLGVVLVSSNCAWSSSCTCWSLLNSARTRVLIIRRLVFYECHRQVQDFCNYKTITNFVTSNVKFHSALEVCSTGDTCVVNLTHPCSGACCDVLKLWLKFRLYMLEVDNI